MPKPKTIYACSKCGAQFPKWAGQCVDCGTWNSITEEAIAVSSHPRDLKFSPKDFSGATILSAVSLQKTPRIATSSSELDRVLGGGLVSGSVILIGGDPGIGKSTLLLQTLCRMTAHHPIPSLYVSGEESLQQITLRAKRLKLPEDSLKLLADTNVERILSVAQQEQPRILVIDSIQTMFTENVSSAPGAVSQVRESAAKLVQYAKQTNTALILVGHVTKEGAIAGPRVLEHMVDTVLYFEGDRNSRLRILRAVKNRFGAVNELGVFAMLDKGLREVSNPSAIFLSRTETPGSGSSVMVTWEGSRPMLVEIQALADQSHLANPRRVTVGLEYNRLAMLLAVLHRHGGIATYDQDVFVNVVGGMRILETAVDLPILLSIISSLKNKPLPTDLVIFGEVGLGGEIRPVQNGLERLREASKHGFKRAIIPDANAPKEKFKEMKIISVKYLHEALVAF
ncbi:MAG: DNA repair protein RadA [Gammaproteobacteria bacterium]|jgi:DNA repair protein RadA/Sms